MKYTIGLGRCGDADCTLTLTKEGEGTKLFLIEGIPWNILSLMQGSKSLPVVIENKYGSNNMYELAEYVYNTFETDE